MHTKPRKKKKPQLSEQEKRKNEKYWVRPLHDLILDEQAQEDIVDIQCHSLANAVTMTTKEVEASSDTHLKKWDSGVKKELGALRTRAVF